MAQNPDNKVSLGCGTLILIAVIVAIFSGGNKTRDLSSEVSNLRDQVRALESQVRIAAHDARDTEKETEELKKTVATLNQTVLSLRESINGQTQLIRELKVEAEKAPAKPLPPVEKE